MKQAGENPAAVNPIIFPDAAPYVKKEGNIEEANTQSDTTMEPACRALYRDGETSSLRCILISEPLIEACFGEE